MKVKISNSKAGETRVDYLKVSDKDSFRFHLLNKVVEGQSSNAVLLIDTNQRVTEKTGLEVLEDLHKKGLDPLAIKIPANPQFFFGFQVRKWNVHDVEYMIVIDLKEQTLTKDLFMLLTGYDIAVGFDQIEPITNQMGLIGTSPVLLLDTCFGEKLYDSILCTRIRSSFDISGYVKEITHEMGL